MSANGLDSCSEFLEFILDTINVYLGHLQIFVEMVS